MTSSSETGEKAGVGILRCVRHPNRDSLLDFRHRAITRLALNNLPTPPRFDKQNIGNNIDKFLF